MESAWRNLDYIHNNIQFKLNKFFVNKIMTPWSNVVFPFYIIGGTFINLILMLMIGWWSVCPLVISAVLGGFLLAMYGDAREKIIDNEIPFATIQEIFKILSPEEAYLFNIFVSATKKITWGKLLSINLRDWQDYPEFKVYKDYFFSNLTHQGNEEAQEANKQKTNTSIANKKDVKEPQLTEEEQMMSLLEQSFLSLAGDVDDELKQTMLHIKETLKNLWPLFGSYSSEKSEVANLINNHLKTTIQIYLQLPSKLRKEYPGISDETHVPFTMLKNQIKIMDRRLGEIEKGLFEKSNQKMIVQEAFIRQNFETPTSFLEKTS